MSGGPTVFRENVAVSVAEYRRLWLKPLAVALLAETRFRAASLEGTAEPAPIDLAALAHAWGFEPETLREAAEDLKAALADGFLGVHVSGWLA